ncbi:7-cyano-7-deazaguanine synthase QueC [Virgibacillus sp. AGTR]|uniref:7-cyano-7-deazaguanine synthase QueC n=1 Tax=unclassified Virgibacillus TaxID=2620237 RepID=UPI0019635AF1|nr:MULTISPECIES: 7-cyano-7-deazaguanine synthase QueC [unclassified Virgibacillus]MCC2248509.1 7-cyano-7-deazaguanine synthase QueC [Virgibacillus sp. AGTR]MDY7043056.1 7-cyano-7-deazaguanine synthase QueC [Virgibacillus sp. M23]QRZ16628.1 7-cyano-7-deazaguanine synthase QueC [Virgibacillus sp. AGTR]
MNDQKAIVVFSGGQDSTTCLFWALRKFEHVEAVTFQYGQRHIEELQVARNICEHLEVTHHLLDMSLLNQLAPNALTRKDIEITENEGELPSTFVPGRNLMFLSFAAILAKQIDAKHLVTGVCETDFSGYPDCRDIFIKSLNVTINLAMDEQFVLHTPLMWLDKAGVWELSDQLAAFSFVKNNTLTCYNGIKGSGCGECPACKLRKNGLEKYEANRKREQAK